MNNEEKEKTVTAEVDEKKAKKEKAKKPKPIPFPEIDITTATEDDIIQSGLKYHTKLDVFCYLIMALIVVLALVPPIIRKVIPKPITELEKDVVYLSVACYRTIARDGYELSSRVNIDYRDGTIMTTKLTFDSIKVAPDAPDDYIFAEINEFNSIEEEGFTIKKENEFNYTYTVDYTKNKDLADNEYLQYYSYFSGPEIDYLKSINYKCDSESETKRELVKADTNEKIKSLD